MSESKKYYWLKLKSDFFDDDTIKFIEEQENGIKYSNFYLKLCLKSLKTDGKLIRLVGETLIPYDINSLSKLTGVDFDTVRSAMQLFESIGLIKVLESGEIYLSQIDELIGSETDKAQMMRRLRAERKITGNNVTQMLPEKEIDKEKEKEIELDIEKDKKINKYNDVVEIYNTYCTNLAQVQKLTEKRKIAINKLLKEINLEQFKEICAIANKSDFLTGNNDRNWKADFDFIIRPDKAVSILEGKYSYKQKDKMDGFMKLWEEARLEDED
jgi:predicted phage replisome organizer